MPIVCSVCGHENADMALYLAHWRAVRHHRRQPPDLANYRESVRKSGVNPPAGAGAGAGDPQAEDAQAEDPQAEVPQEEIAPQAVVVPAAQATFEGYVRGRLTELMDEIERDILRSRAEAMPYQISRLDADLADLARLRLHHNL